MYDVNRIFIERFVVSLVNVPEPPPGWLKFELEMVEDELAYEKRREHTYIEQEEGGDGAASKDDKEGDRFHYYSRGHVPLVSSGFESEQVGVKVDIDDD